MKKKAIANVGEDFTVQDSIVNVTDEQNRKLITITLTCEKKLSVPKLK